MKKNALLFTTFFLFTINLWGTVCYNLSSSSNILSISLEPNDDYTGINSNWTVGTITISWPQSIGDEVIEGVAAQNGWPFIATGSVEASGGFFYQKFSMTSTYTSVLLTGVSVEILQITVNQPITNFSLDTDPPIGNPAALNNFFGNQYSPSFCDSPPCVLDLVVSGNPIQADIYYADNSITSAGTVASPSLVEFYALNNISLSSGFEVELGAEFADTGTGCDVPVILEIVE